MTTKRKHDHPENKDDLPPRQIYNLRDYYQPTKTEPFHKDIYQENIPIAIDIGRSEFRIGMANFETPNTRFPSVTARYRDRKLNKSYVMVGNDVFIDSSIRSNLKTPFDGALITNWDAMERIFDYSFLHLGVNSNDRVNNPIVVNELLATPLNQRSTMMELLFESYSAPKVCFGHDSLFSFYGNGGKSGLVIGTGHESTHIIPVIKGNPVINISKRIDIGGHQMTDFLKWFLGLKYPYFPTRITNWQIENMIHDHCYISKDFNKEIKTYLNLDNIEKNDIILEAPFTEIVKVEKTEEELKVEAEKRKENIKKLQDQAKTKRLEKLMIKEKDYQYYSDLKEKMKSMNKKQILEILREASFDDEEDLNKYLLSLERSLKRARQKDVGDIEEEETQQHDFSILDIPDSELDEDKIKEKRKLRLIKSNIDARIRARKEKEEAKKEADEAVRLDNEFREKDLVNWTKSKRQQLDLLVKRRRERLKLKEELTDRKSRAAQQRMKNIATLAADDTNAQGNSRNKKRQTNTTIDNDPNDTFGANDDDWAVYRDIASIDDEEVEEEEEDSIFNLEKELLEYDPTFTIEDTQERQFNWRNSTLHKFLRGPRDFDNEDQHQLHQIHLNIERIRIPEIMFQPSISGVDQAGIIEICDDTLSRRLPQELGFSGDYQEDIGDVLKDIFITGGSGLFDNFEDRLRNEFRTFLPSHAKFNVRTANNPRLDAWRGMAKWSLSDESKESFISIEDYQELGVDYIKENRMGCIKLI